MTEEFSKRTYWFYDDLPEDAVALGYEAIECPECGGSGAADGWEEGEYWYEDCSDCHGHGVFWVAVD